MRIESLTLYNFRNLDDATVTFSPTLNLITGQNGQGKTNLLEAVHLLSHARSFRTNDLEELVRWGEKAGSVFAKLREGEDSTETKLGVIISEGKRQIFVNSDEVKSVSEFIGRVPSVSFAPDDLELVKGGPQLRRRFLDRHMVDVAPQTLRPLMSYQRALKNKNALFKERYVDRDGVMAWNRVLAQHALPLVVAKREFVSRLAAEASRLHSAFAPNDGAMTLAMKERSGTGEGEPTAEAILRALDDAYDRESQQRSSLIGPHRDDLVIDLAGKPARSFASQGQTRSIVLAMKLAVISLIEAARNDTPLVLLDDVDSELDETRGALLFELLSSRPRQTFVTGTGERFGRLLQDGNQARILRVDGGRITPLSEG